MMKRYKYLIWSIVLLELLLCFSLELKAGQAGFEYYSHPELEKKVLKIAKRHGNGEVIVVSKKDHLLYFCRNGFIVRGDRFGGFVHSFPVPISLGVNNRWTPEGKFKIYVKNPQSRFTLFLGFKDAYGIHGAATQLASKLNRLEALDPNLEFVTRKDNTLGCVAVENRTIKYLYAKVNVETPLFIMP
ncbi:L,D-transpeptidase [Candidatus Saganbacteria bacterium]|nr:L,D-transpeptidase [Candidatus Saganbacteria bacterium]